VFAEVPFAALDQIAAGLDRTVDEWFARVRATGRSEDRPACRRGCAACCHQLVPLTILEAQRIGEHLSRMPRQQRRQIGASLERHFSRFSAWVKDRPPGDIRDRAVNLDYLRQRNPCPFLGPANECRIYPVRPLICRGHHALETNARCQTGETVIRTIPAVDAATTQAMRQTQELVSQLGLPSGGGLISSFVPLFRAAIGQKNSTDAR
jgi:Fe-S-cluster containining protein